MLFMIAVFHSLLATSTAQVVLLLGTGGEFSSPIVGKSYPDNLNYTWQIETNLPGRTIVLYFTKFEIEDSYDFDLGGSCVYDYIKIKDENKEYAKLCGSMTDGSYDAPKLRQEFKSISNKLIVNFITDYSNEAPKLSGFKAHYSIVDKDECSSQQKLLNSIEEDWDQLLYCNHHCINIPGSYTCACEVGYTLDSNKHTCVADCGQTLYNAETGSIQPRLRKNVYSKLANCKWNIKKTEGFIVHLRFIGDFEIEDHFEEGCAYDWLQYTDHNGALGPKYCGDILPNKGQWIDTKSHDITMNFVTDLSIEKIGFHLEYKFERVKCNEVLKAPVNGKIVQTTSVFESTATFSCNTGYRLIGNAVLTCMANGQWSSATPICQIKKCTFPNHLKNIVNGKIVTDPVKLEYASVVKTACYIWYELSSGSQTWTCEDDEEWHPEFEVPGQDNKPVCKTICGLKGNKDVLSGKYDFGTAIPRDEEETAQGLSTQILGGKPAKKAEWPWVAFIDIKGRNGITENEDTCGGSLVSNNVIVTAAHCFDYYVSESTVIYLGAFRRSNQSNIDIQTFSVKKLHIHPDYDDLTKIHDIAVIVLNASVQIGFHVRPICLPLRTKEKELPYRGLTEKEGYQKQGVITGWGKMTNVKGDSLADFLQMVRIPAILHETCKSTFEKIKIQDFRELDISIADTQLCGGSLYSTRDSCQGDSGGPFMYKDVATSRWFLNGIVSYGSTPQECGLNTFGIYTNVAKYISWIGNFVQL